MDLTRWKRSILFTENTEGKRDVEERRRFNAALRRRRLRGGGGAPGVKRKRDDSGAAEVVDLTGNDAGVVDLTGNDAGAAEVVALAPNDARTRRCIQLFADMKWRTQKEHRELRTPAAWEDGPASKARELRRSIDQCECVLDGDGSTCARCKATEASLAPSVRKSVQAALGRHRLGGYLEQSLESLGENPLRFSAALDRVREDFTRRYTYVHRINSKETRQEALAFCAALDAYRKDASNNARFWALMASLRPGKWRRARAQGCIGDDGIPLERCLRKVRDMKGYTESDKLRKAMDKEIARPAPRDNILEYLLLGNEVPQDDQGMPLVDNTYLIPASQQWRSWDAIPPDGDDGYLMLDMGQQQDDISRDGEDTSSDEEEASMHRHKGKGKAKAKG